MRELIWSILQLGLSILFYYFFFYKLIYKTIIKKTFKTIKGTTSIFSLSKEEQGAFQQMMLAPTNETVSTYIIVLKKFADYLTKYGASGSADVGSHMKYANAYQIVKETPSVSEELKEELYKMFLILGVPLQK